MILTRGTPSRFFLIRTTFPLIFLAVTWTSPGPNWLVLGFLALNSVDVIGGIIQFLWKPSLVDYRFAAFRDVVYAFGFYAVVLQNPHIPALVLAPSTLAELFILFGSRVFLRAVVVETVLLFVRMTVMRQIDHLLHPTWAILIITASVLMGLLGLEITRLEELQKSIVMQREQLKETLTEMVSVTLAQSGLDKGVMQEEHLDPLLEEICQEADRLKGRDVGLRIASAMAKRQDASNMLTAREQEVLALVAADQSYREISEHLQVSPGTVRAHVASLMRKAQVHTRAELTQWARQNQLVCTASTLKAASPLHVPEAVRS